MSIAIGDKVQWNWGSGTGEGVVVHRYTQKITLEIAGAEVTRNADHDTPAFRIEQEDGSEVLKSLTELEKL